MARRPKSGALARQQRSKPVIEALKPWFEDSLARMSKGSKLAEALAYGLNHWDGLCRFLEDGRIEIDSNTVERSIRGLALARKNTLFAGHDRGAAGWAMIASLLETCKHLDAAHRSSFRVRGASEANDIIWVGRISSTADNLELRMRYACLGQVSKCSIEKFSRNYPQKSHAKDPFVLISRIGLLAAQVHPQSKPWPTF